MFIYTKCRQSSISLLPSDIYSGMIMRWDVTLRPRPRCDRLRGSGGGVSAVFSSGIATMNDLANGGSVSRFKVEWVVSRLFLALSVMLTTAGVARADKFTDIERFAQSICGDIPEATLTRTSIQGRVKAECRRFNYTETAYIGGATMRVLNQLNATNCERPSINEEECSAKF